MAKALFIGEDYLKKNTPVQPNVDGDIIIPYITKTQDITIHQSLGTTFYEHLQTAFIGNTLTTDETDLIRNYLQPVLSEFSYYHLIPHLNYKSTNKAISTESSEFSTPSSLEEIKFLRSTVRDMGEFLLKRLNVYLCDNSSLFPKYNNPDTDENLKKNTNSYFNGIYLAKPRGCNCGTSNCDC